MATLDLAAIGNCAIASLITKTGRHVWFCLPRFDGDPVFAALVDGDAPERGFHDVVFSGEANWNQRYLPNTAIVETTATDASGACLKIVDFAPRHERFGRSFHPQLLIRTIAPVAGRPRIRVRMRPTFDLGASTPSVSQGSNHIRYSSSSLTLRVTTDMPLAYLVDESEFTLDRPIHLFIGADEPVPENLATLAANFLAETESYWRRWVRGLSIPFEWQDEVIRSAITLKLCNFEDTGAIVAALTTSIPEAPSTTRNWDYRYCWLRDAYFTVGALNRLGATRTMEGFIRFILDAVLADKGTKAIAPLYRVCGQQDLYERVAPALRGYLGMGPVRFGNGAASQMQDDVYGSIILTATQMFWDRRLPSAGDRALYEQLLGVGRTALDRAFRPDAGPWEYRGRVLAHTYSAAMCWAAAHRLSMIAAQLDIREDAEEWRAKASGIRSEVLARATTSDGWISGVLDQAVVDASTLLLTEIGIVSPSDPRVAKTLDMVAERLMRDGFVYRYHEADDFGEPQTAFLICTFWYCDALGLAGRKAEAREIFENAIACRNHVGLLSEDFDTRSKTLWGNFPQAYSHVGLIHSASRLSRGWEEAIWRAS
ncbi:MAG: glycoside hydrolase family 15 protein [Alphaproteobacteria bacterium]|nr:glycoside hydrolase family 15 protein [Alphaproteobacteria bacterium]